MKKETLSHCNLCQSNNLKIIDHDHNICICVSCGFIFDNPRPTIEELISFYSKPSKYDSWIAEENSRDKLWKRRLKKLEKTKKDGTLLDVGTGTGQFLYHAKKNYTEVSGTEVSDSAINIAKEKYGLDIIRGEIEQVVVDKSFDNITLFHVLEHVPNPRTVIEKCWTMLSFNGILIISVPNDVLSLKTRIKAILSKFRKKNQNSVRRCGLPLIRLDGSLNEIHLSHFTPEVLCQLLKKTGFKVIDNSLDPYYAAQGIKLIFFNLYYAFHSLLFSITGKNRYDTIWIAAKKI